MENTERLRHAPEYHELRITTCWDVGLCRYVYGNQHFRIRAASISTVNYAT
jgi:hypothetical protein